MTWFFTVVTIGYFLDFIEVHKFLALMILGGLLCMVI